jgi:hypothetical protein
MNVKKFLIQLGATFVSAALGNLGMAQILGVEEWKAAVMSGGYVVLEVIRKLAIALRDGSLTEEETSDLFVAIELDGDAK